MTSRNLNGNWVDTLSLQYSYDLKDNSPHPIKYLLWNPQKKKDLYYLIPNKIEVQELRRSLVKYHQATKGASDIEWQNEHVKVILHPRYSQETGAVQSNDNDEDNQREPPYRGIPSEETQDQQK
ncbi:hypothetical protein BU23DRAFT_549122 [Bimuria novae-zelandiae CBS 107.79]|uniref:Uncharacterized protein n=1 Tax=Bimuria novae-zelandiae CBS 107.79 TaxID=1447943 RepID=A0A6A5VYH8_9PLEO|nr:hypothetical protein BU23DRAFT_549122 [Bimuria novae-zelandiae CBS 107.79]